MKQRNQAFVILSAIGILLVALGHLDFPILSFGGLFHYYSFHVMLFVFISGYFYNPEEEADILSYVKRKCLHLLLPYFIWNVFYGGVAMVLHHFGMQIGEDISLYNLFIAPFMGGHQFLYNAAAWFVPTLFLVELCNIIGRRILSACRIRNEYVIFLLYLVIGILSVYLAKRGSVYGFYKLPGRIMFLVPAFQMGRLYKAELESRDTLPGSLYFLILFALQCLIFFPNYGQIGYSAVWVTGFSHSVLLPYLTTITGIALWLRIAKELTPLLSKNRFIGYLGTHTFSVMTHHLFGFFLVNAIFAGLSSAGFLPDFDFNAFTSDIYYTYAPFAMSEIKWLYLAAGITFSLGISLIGERIARFLPFSSKL